MPERINSLGETVSTSYDEPNNLPQLDEGDSVSLREAGGAIWSERKFIARVGLITLAVAAVCAFIMPVHYTATAAFIPPSSTSSASSLLASQLSSLAGASALLGGGSKGSGDLYVGILKSRSIADDLISRFSLMKIYKVKKLSAAEKILAQKSKFDADIKSSIVTIKVTDNNPTRARDLVEGYLDELHSANGRLALTDSSQRRLFFEQQLAKEKDALENAEVDLKKTQQRTGLIAPAGQTASEILSLAQMRAEITGREVQLAALRQSVTDQNPDAIQLQSQIKDLREQLAKRQSGTRTGKIGDTPASQVPESGLEFIQKAREVQYHETLFEIIAKQYEAARIDEARDSPLLQVLDRPVVPDTKSGPSRLLIMIAGLLCGILGGVIWVLFKAAKLREDVATA